MSMRQTAPGASRMGYSPRSKRDAVELGLRTLVRLQQQGDLEAPTRSRPTGDCCRLLGVD